MPLRRYASACAWWVLEDFLDGPQVAEDEWKVATELAGYRVENYRPEDRVAAILQIIHAIMYPYGIPEALAQIADDPFNGAQVSAAVALSVNRHLARDDENVLVTISSRQLLEVRSRFLAALSQLFSARDLEADAEQYKLLMQLFFRSTNQGE